MDKRTYLLTRSLISLVNMSRDKTELYQEEAFERFVGGAKLVGVQQLAEHLKRAFKFNKPPTRRRIAIKTVIAQAGTMIVFTACGRFDLGLLSILGVFSIFYAPEAPYRRRLTVVTGVVLTLIAGAIIGISTSHNQALLLVALTILAPLAAFVCNALLVGPPGAYFVLLSCGIIHYMVAEHGLPPGEILLMTAVGGAVALIITMTDLALDPGRPERLAVNRADAAITALVEAGTQATHGLQRAAGEALHQAWSAIGDAEPFFPNSPLGARRSRRVAAEKTRLIAAQRRFDRINIALSQHIAGVSDPNDATGTDVNANTEVIDSMESSALSVRGRLPARVLLEQSAKWPSENLVTAFRVLFATALAGVLTLGTSSGHIYWSIAFAALALHQGGARTAQTYRGINRLVGTLCGIGVFYGIVAWHPSVWVMIGIVAVLQLMIDTFVARQYAIASTFITPMALLISIGGHFPENPWPLAGERLLDTFIGVTAAMIALWLLGRRLPIALLRGHTVRALDAAADFLDDPHDGERADRLYTQLRLIGDVADNISADGGTAAGLSLGCARDTEHIGFLLLGALASRDANNDIALEPDVLPRLRATLLDAAGRLRGAHSRANDVELGGTVTELTRIVAEGYRARQ